MVKTVFLAIEVRALVYVRRQGESGQIIALVRKAATAIQHQYIGRRKGTVAHSRPGMREVVREGDEGDSGVFRKKAFARILRFPDLVFLKIGALYHEAEVADTDTGSIKAILYRSAIVAPIVFAAGEAFLFDGHHQLAVFKDTGRPIVRETGTEDIYWFGQGNFLAMIRKTVEVWAGGIVTSSTAPCRKAKQGYDACKALLPIPAIAQMYFVIFFCDGFEFTALVIV